MAGATPHGKPLWARAASIADYDGAPDKEDSATERVMPYTAVFYVELRDNLRGSAYTKKSDGLVHCENLMFARALGAGLMRAADKFRFNMWPGTSDNRLEYWVRVYDIPVRATEARYDIRMACAARYKLLLNNNRQHIEDGLADLLGPLYVRTWYTEGTDLANPPPQTYWPTENPGPAAFDLGGGTWFSERSSIMVEVRESSSMPLEDYLDTVNTKLFRYLNRALPVYTTFDWGVCRGELDATGVMQEGFVLDEDELDFGTLGP
jgi:hypothetical protein